MEKWLYASKTMKKYQVVCDECGRESSMSDPNMFPLKGDEYMGMIPVKLPPTKPRVPSLGMTATEHAKASEQCDFDFCGVQCLADFMAKRVSSDSSTNVKEHAPAPAGACVENK